MRPILKNWYITVIVKEEGAVYYAHGTVFGHSSPRCFDGNSIHTSRILNIEASDGERLSIQTRNTLYTVKLSEYGTSIDAEDAAAGDVFPENDEDKTAEALKHFDIPEEIYGRMREFRRERFVKRNALIEACSAKLENDEMYLALSDSEDYYFDFGIIKKSEEAVMLHKAVHIGMFQDSVILMNEYESAARYFPHQNNNLAFYDSLYSMMSEDTPRISSGTRLGYIRNTGGLPLNIQFTWGKCITLDAGEETEVRYMETGSSNTHLTNTSDKYPAM